MRGTVYKKGLPSGSVVWQLQVDAGRDEHGKRLRISRSFRRKGDADDELSRLLQERRDGSLVKPSPNSLREFLLEWLREHAERNCGRKTAERYRQLLSYPIDALGNVALRDLSTLILERFYSRLHDSPGKAGKPLSARSVHHVHDTIRSALNTAIRWKLLKVNPAVACQLPKIKPKEARILEDAHLEFLLDAARGHAWLYALLFLDIATGLRRGELLALTWPDLDLIHHFIVVAKSLEQTRAGLQIKTPKNEKTRRLTLPATAVDVLQDHRRAQQEFRDAYGDDYRTDLDLIFAKPNGDYLKPNTVSPAVCELAAKCGLKGISLHSLRHTHGSQLLSAGVPLVTVSKRLGHSSINVTAEIYAHSFAADEIAAAELWEQKIGAKIRHQTQWQHVAARQAN